MRIFQKKNVFLPKVGVFKRFLLKKFIGYDFICTFATELVCL